MSVLITSWVIKSSVLLSLGLLIAYRRKLSAASRHLFLLLALGSLPLLTVFEHQIQTRLVVFNAPVPLLEVALDLQRYFGQETTTAVQITSTDSLMPSPVSALWIVYALGVLIVALRLLIGLLACHREFSSMPIIGYRAGVQIRQGGGPFAWGLLRHHIVVPATWSQWTEQRRTAVFLHEKAHLARHDMLVSVLSLMCCGLFWFHPLVWLARRQLLLLAEQACDDTVLASGIEGEEYAGYLVATARDNATFAQSIAPAMGTSSNLKNRIKALLDDNVRRVQMSWSHKFLNTVFAVSLSTVVLSVGAGGNPSLRDNNRVTLQAIKGLIDDGQYVEAQAQAQAAIADPAFSGAERAHAASLAGFIYFQMADYGAAIEQYREILQYDGDTGPKGLALTARFTLAQLEFVQGDYADAKGWIQEFIAAAAEPDYRALIFLAQTHYLLREYDDALIALDEGLAQAQAEGVKENNQNWLKLRAFLGNETGAEWAEGDQVYYPLVKSAPIYPVAAKAAGIEGYVVVEFTVGPDGRTQGVSVVEAHPDVVFNQAAIAAAQRFRYLPRVVNGVTEPVLGVRNKIKFAL